jgi:hypothetical protein
LRIYFTFSEEGIVGIDQARQFRNLMKQAGMSKDKRDHSERVTQGIHSLFVSPKYAKQYTKRGVVPPLDPSQWTVVMAALFHDFLERGGDHSVLEKLGLPSGTIQVIDVLTSDKGDEYPLEHLQKVLPTLDENLKNMVILIKLSDRIDNLSKRVDAGGIGNNYMNKSNELVKWLFQQYTGDPSYLMILRKRLKALGIKAKKKYMQNPSLRLSWT